MKRIVALVLALGVSRPCFAEDPLRAALHQLHGHVRFVDVTREGRLIAHGSTLMRFGWMALQETPELRSSDDDDDGKAVLVWGLASLIAIGIGGAMHLTGRAMQNAAPPAILAAGQAKTYMTAEGLNLFMRFSEDEQYQFAVNEPELKAFLIKLNDAYNLITYYGML